MNIGIFSAQPLNSGGGAEVHFIDLANEMSKRGNNIQIINLNKKFDDCLKFILSIYYHHKLSGFRYDDREINHKLKDVKWVRSSLTDLRSNLNDVDIIYTKNEILELIILKLVRFQKMVIIGIHTPIKYHVSRSINEKFHNWLYLSKFYEWLIKDCCAIIVQNSDDIIIIKNNFDFDKVFLIGYPFRPKIATELTIKVSHNDIFNILFVGRLTEQKGIDTLSKIIYKLSYCEEFKNMQFTIIGSGELEDDVIYLEKKFNNVRYLGHINESDIHNYYLHSDMLIAPSRYETFHIVSLEAQGYGLPVVVSDIPGPRDIIIDRYTGFLVKNVEEFVDKILHLYYLKAKDPNKFVNLKHQIYRYTNERFDPKKIYDRIEKIFEMLSRDR